MNRIRGPIQINQQINSASRHISITFIAFRYITLVGMDAIKRSFGMAPEEPSLLDEGTGASDNYCGLTLKQVAYIYCFFSFFFL